MSKKKLILEVIRITREHFDHPSKFGINEKGECRYINDHKQRCAVGHYAHTQGVSDEVLESWNNMHWKQIYREKVLAELPDQFWYDLQVAHDTCKRDPQQLNSHLDLVEEPWK